MYTKNTRETRSNQQAFGQATCALSMTSNSQIHWTQFALNDIADFGLCSFNVWLIWLSVLQKERDINRAIASQCCLSTTNMISISTSQSSPFATFSFESRSHVALWEMNRFISDIWLWSTSRNCVVCAVAVGAATQSVGLSVVFADCVRRYAQLLAVCAGRLNSKETAWRHRDLGSDRQTNINEM